MAIRKQVFRTLVPGLLLAAGLALAPSAFAHGRFSIGIDLPGVSVGYWGGHHGHGYVDVGVGGYYGGYYGGGYYAPAYYDSYYYAPAPVYYGAHYSEPVYRSYDRSRYHDRDDDRRYYRDYGRGYDSDRGYHRAGYNRGYSCGSSDPRYCR
ncbi:MAG: hypothetical protein ACYC9P_09855 [Rudaea sp.]